MTRKRAVSPGLALRINILIVGAIALTAVGLVALTTLFVARQNRTELEHKAAIVAEMLAENGRFGMYTGNADDLSRVVEALRRDPSIAFVRFSSHDGRTILEIPLIGGTSYPTANPTLPPNGDRVVTHVPASGSTQSW